MYDVANWLYLIKFNVRSYIARYPVIGTVQGALHFTPWQTCSFQRHFDFSGNHSAKCNYCAKTIRIKIHLSVLFTPTLSPTITQKNGVMFPAENALAQHCIKPRAKAADLFCNVTHLFSINDCLVIYENRLSLSKTDKIIKLFPTKIYLCKVMPKKIIKHFEIPIEIMKYDITLLSLSKTS